jgi:hypothetical protein
MVPRGLLAVLTVSSGFTAVGCGVCCTGSCWVHPAMNSVEMTTSKRRIGVVFFIITTFEGSVKFLLKVRKLLIVFNF